MTSLLLESVDGVPQPLLLAAAHVGVHAAGRGGGAAGETLFVRTRNNWGHSNAKILF